MAVYIQLTRGMVCEVDPDDRALVAPYRWQLWENGTHRYARVGIKSADGTRRTISMHRLIMGLPDIQFTVDHIDGDGLNNCRSNLRLVSRGQNRRNSIKRRAASCSFKGVYKKEHKWRAQISDRTANLPTVPWFIGDFETAIDAAIAYDAVARILFREHARVNFPRLGEQSAQSSEADAA